MAKSIIDQIRAKIEDLENMDYPCDTVEQYTGYHDALDYVWGFLDTLQEPGVEECAEVFLSALSKTPYNNRPITDAQIIVKQLLIFFKDANKYDPDAILQEPEVNLEKEINSFWDSCIKHKNERGGNVIWSNKIEVEVLARHFYELGKNTKCESVKDCQDLEAAAEKYADKHGFRVPYDGSNNYYDDVDVKASKEGFKAGAEWMAGQGETIEDEVGACQDAEMTPLVEVGPKTFKAGDKVIVQIRKR